MSWRALAPLACTLFCTALACAAPSPRIELSPLPPNQTRIILYMAVATELPSYCPKLTVDGAAVGKLCVGNFFAVDQPPGVHQVGVGIDKNLSAFGEQGVTEPVDLTLGPGETGYVQVYALAMSQQVKVMLTKEPAANGSRDISSLRLANRQTAP